MEIGKKGHAALAKALTRWWKVLDGQQRELLAGQIENLLDAVAERAVLGASSRTIKSVVRKAKTEAGK